MEWNRGEFKISTEKALLQVDRIHSFLFRSYWSPGIPMENVEKGIKNSLTFGVYDQEAQIGFSRVISDYISFAYLADVFIFESHRGKGLSKWLMECILVYPDLKDIRRFVLATKDAHGLYQQFGFKPLAEPQRFMEKISRPGWLKEVTSK